jgi:hypothetical protein
MHFDLLRLDTGCTYAWASSACLEGIGISYIFAFQHFDTLETNI